MCFVRCICLCCVSIAHCSIFPHWALLLFTRFFWFLFGKQFHSHINVSRINLTQSTRSKYIYSAYTNWFPLNGWKLSFSTDERYFATFISHIQTTGIIKFGDKTDYIIPCCVLRTHFFPSSSSLEVFYSVASIILTRFFSIFAQSIVCRRLQRQRNEKQNRPEKMIIKKVHSNNNWFRNVRPDKSAVYNFIVSFGLLAAFSTMHTHTHCIASFVLLLSISYIGIALCIFNAFELRWLNSVCVFPAVRLKCVNKISIHRLQRSIVVVILLALCSTLSFSSAIASSFAVPANVYEYMYWALCSISSLFLCVSWPLCAWHS